MSANDDAVALGISPSAVCENCIFWDREYDEATTGHCRRLPPRQGSSQERWPITHDIEWCGSFRERSP